MTGVPMKALALAGMLLGAPAIATAQDAGLPVENVYEVPGHVGIYYFDLLRQVFPDARANEGLVTAREHVDIRPIGGEDYASPIPTEIRIGSFYAKTFLHDGHEMIALLANIGEAGALGTQPAMLAIFDDQTVPQLVDVVDVGLDDTTMFEASTPVRIRPDEDAIVTVSRHFNSNEDYASLLLMTMMGKKLELIDEFSAMNTRGCGFQSSQTYAFTPGQPNSGKPYDGVDVSLQAELRHVDSCAGDALPAEYSFSASAHYEMNTQTFRFGPTSEELAILERKLADMVQ